MFAALVEVKSNLKADKYESEYAFYLVELLARGDADDAANHLGDDDHVAEVRFGGSFLPAGVACLDDAHDEVCMILLLLGLAASICRVGDVAELAVSVAEV